MKIFEDEFTYYAEGKPKIANATCKSPKYTNQCYVHQIDK